MIYRFTDSDKLPWWLLLPGGIGQQSGNIDKEAPPDDCGRIIGPTLPFACGWTLPGPEAAIGHKYDETKLTTDGDCEQFALDPRIFRAARWTNNWKHIKPSDKHLCLQHLCITDFIHIGTYDGGWQEGTELFASLYAIILSSEICYQKTNLGN